MNGLDNRIRRARDEAGLTQAELAEAIDVVPQQVSKYERGKDVPTIKRLYLISEVTKKPLYWFFLEPTGVTLDFPASRHGEFWDKVCQLEFDEFVCPYLNIQVPTAEQFKLAHQEREEGHHVDYARLVVSDYEMMLEDHYSMEPSSTREEPQKTHQESKKREPVEERFEKIEREIKDLKEMLSSREGLVWTDSQVEQFLKKAAQDGQTPTKEELQALKGLSTTELETGDWSQLAARNDKRKKSN